MAMFPYLIIALFIVCAPVVETQKEVCLIDVALVIDHSGSIRDTNRPNEPDNWGLVLSFIRSIVNKLNIGEQESHMAAVSFGNTATLNFDFNAYKDRQSMLQGVNKIKYLSGNTNTTGGLREARLNVFSKKGGDRPDVRDILILLTDGVPTREEDMLEDEIKRIKDRDIRIIAIGVTDQIDENLLRRIVSEPNTTHYFSVKEFSLLEQNLNGIINEACRTLKPLPPTLATPEACANPVDLVFVLDSSGSIEHRHFSLMKNFVSTTIEQMDLDSGNSRVGLLTFADREELQFRLERYNTRMEASNAVLAVRHTRGTTNTAAALRYARENMYDSGVGGRSQAADVLIVFTDGGSNDKRATQNEAHATRRAGIHVIVVGLGKMTDENELIGMASYPHSQNKLDVRNYEDLDSYRDRLRDLFCNNENECTRNPCMNGATCIDGIGTYLCKCTQGWAGKNCDTRCRMRSDVIFALDASGSIGQRHFQQQVDFVQSVVSHLNMNGDSRVGALTYANSASIRFHLNDYASRYDVMNALSFYYTGGTTNTANAIATMRNDMFTSPRGDRSGVPNIGVIITDGRSDDETATWDEAVKTRRDGVSLIAIGVGNNVKTRELEGIASAPSDQNVLRSSDFSALVQLQNKLISAICQSDDHCVASPCQGGATCLSSINGYECRCTKGRSGKNCERRCDSALDIIFVLDNSGSIRRERFSKILDLASNIVSQFEVSATATRFGALSFSNSAQMEFNLKDYSSQQDVIMRLHRIRFNGGRTHTSSALRMAKDQMFTSGNGDRQDAQNIAIVITDGNSNINEDRTIPDAIDARLKGIHMIVIAIGELLNELELRGIASQPPDTTLFNARSWRDLPAQLNSLVSATCDDQNECQSSPCRNGGRCINALKRFYCECSDDYSGEMCTRRCRRSMDVVFVLDLSGSVDLVYDVSLRFIRRVIYGLPMRFDRARVGLVSYADRAHVQFKLNTYEGLQEVLNALSFRKSGGRTNTQEALRMMYEEVFTGSGGDRSGIDNIAIVVTDGGSNVQSSRTLTEADIARRRGIEIYTVALTERPDMAEVNGIASQPDSEHVIRVRNANDVDRGADQLLDLLCE